MMSATATYSNFGGRLLHESRGGVETEYVSDTLGSLAMCMDMSQNATYTAEYWPYGEVQVETGSNPSSWGFVGLLGYFKDLASLLYVRARHYRPGLTQWQTLDPLWPQEKAYAYALNVPIGVVDPTGKCVGPLPCTRQEIDYCKTTVCGSREFNYCVAEICNLGCGRFERISYCKCNKSKGCKNSCPPPRIYLDLVPPQKPHYFKQLGCCCKGNHTHIVEYDQTPYPDCKCIAGRRREGTCIYLADCKPGPC